MSHTPPQAPPLSAEEESALRRDCRLDNSDEWQSEGIQVDFVRSLFATLDTERARANAEKERADKLERALVNAENVCLRQGERIRQLEAERDERDDVIKMLLCAGRPRVILRDMAQKKNRDARLARLALSIVEPVLAGATAKEGETDG
jgi:hypothetical protein